MTVTETSPDDLSWINEMYAGIKFKLSTESDLIVCGELDGKRAGIGRLVRVDEKNGELGGIYVVPEFRGRKVADEIVRTLLMKNSFPILWCIPFEPLEKFYRKFGFRDVLNEKIPSPIQEKLEWCEGRYPHKAILLIK